MSSRIKRQQFQKCGRFRMKLNKRRRAVEDQPLLSSGELEATGSQNTGGCSEPVLSSQFLLTAQ